VFDPDFASISLLGSGNQGETLEGSAVTNRTTYTRSDGSLGAVVAVDFVTNTIGDVATSVNGGTLILSVPDNVSGKATPSGERSIEQVACVSNDEFRYELLCLHLSLEVVASK